MLVIYERVQATLGFCGLLVKGEPHGAATSGGERMLMHTAAQDHSGLNL